MKMEFTKMHGTGNDYVYVNCMEQELPNPGAISEYISTDVLVLAVMA